MTAVHHARGFHKGSLEKNPLLSHWLDLDTPGVVTLRVGKVEIGQGIGTALAQIAAEELDVSLDRIRMAPLHTAHSPDEGVTSGSFSVQHSGEAVRLVCASVRALAIAAYARLHDVPADSVQVADGSLRSPHSDAVGDFWVLRNEFSLEQPVGEEVAAKQGALYRTVGTSTPRRDLEGKVFGRASFIHDMVLDQMLHARVVRVPHPRARLLGVDATAVCSRFPGVEVVRDGSFLGVLAPREEMAVAAAELLHGLSQWELPDDLPDSGDLAAFLQGVPSEPSVVAAVGAGTQVVGAIELQARYSRPFLAHASIGPSCALAHWREGRLDVWCHSQGIHNLKADIEVYLQRDHPAMPGANVVVHHVEGSGCYGHNPADDVAFDAVLLARFAGGRPVRVLWSRADELACGPLGPAHLVELEAHLGPDGRVAWWNEAIWANGYTCRPGRSEPGSLSFLGASQIAQPFKVPVSLDPPLAVGGGSDRNALPSYVFPHCKVVTNRLLVMPLRTSAIRALGGYANVFAIESFMDELAHAAGRDPVQFRLEHLDDPRAAAVIRLAIGNAPWWHQRQDDEEGTGRGLAFARYKNTGAWCAVAVRVLAGERIRVLDISIAADMGLVVNPDGAANQLEGGAIQSCSWTLLEEVRFSRNQVTTRSWADYPILGFTDAPSVRVSLADQPGEPSLGAGEAAQGPTAGAIGNAVFDALGVRVRQLPITPERILATS
jgi:nicotinate dehydrogenase subunit B